MDKFDRIFQLHNVLSHRRTPISGEELMARLDCSKATLHRIINALRDALGAPIVYDTNVGGYRYAASGTGTGYELPGLWFSAHELQALALMKRLIQDAGGGLLEEYLAPLNRRLDQLVKHQRLNLGEASARLRFPAIASRPAGTHFGTMCAATLQRRKLWIEYHARSTDERTERTLSPQRVVHCRETWYLDAWDDARDALRSFSIDRIRHATTLDEPALDVPDSELDEHYSSAYGIFGGKADKLAVLRFTKERARWVADEKWHPQQEERWLEDGSYELRIPYREPRELVMDILRHGAGVEVCAPSDLRESVVTELGQAVARSPEAAMPSALALKERHRQVRDAEPEALRLRIHRALSWLLRAEQLQEDPDTRFILYWISLNAAYAREFVRRNPNATERGRSSKCW